VCWWSVTMFRRKVLQLPVIHSDVPERYVLVINSNTASARYIQREIEAKLEGCSILYAPTLELAKLMLSRHAIELIVSNAVLPDGSVTNLRSTLEKLGSPPDVIVVGDVTTRSADVLKAAGYTLASARRFGAELPIIHRRRPPSAEHPSAEAPLSKKISDISADLRNDLNNPLQEIVAMVFVARVSGGAQASTSQALEAINRAAQGMAKVVWGIEQKFQQVVGQ